VTRAEALSQKPEHVGAAAFSRTGDPATGVFGDATIIKKFGDVPSDLIITLFSYWFRTCGRRRHPILPNGSVASRIQRRIAAISFV
jgi:hypothetical protein